MEPTFSQEGLIYLNQHDPRNRNKEIIMEQPRPKTPVSSGSGEGTFMRALEQIRDKQTPVKSIVFNEKGGWAILAGKNDFYSANVSESMVAAINQFRAEDYEITDLALNNKDEYVVVFSDGWGHSYQLDPEQNQALVENLKLFSTQGRQIKDMVFTRDDTPGFVIIYQVFNFDTDSITLGYTSSVNETITPILNDIIGQMINESCY